MAVRKIAVSIPEEIVDDLNYISGRMSITRSALLSNMLSVPAQDLRGLLENLPENPTVDDVLRSRGASAQIIDQRIQSVRDMESDLFSGRMLK